MNSKLLRLAIGIAITCYAMELHAQTATPPPIITRADAHVSTSTLFVEGANFIVSPTPVVLLGTEAGGFQSLTVLSATSSTMTAVLPLISPGSYLLIAQFGTKPILTAAIVVAGRGIRTA